MGEREKQRARERERAKEREITTTILLSLDTVTCNLSQSIHIFSRLVSSPQKVRASSQGHRAQVRHARGQTERRASSASPLQHLRPRALLQAQVQYGEQRVGKPEPNHAITTGSCFSTQTRTNTSHNQYLATGSCKP